MTTSTRYPSARARARAAMQADKEKQRRREAGLAALFAALDKIDAAKRQAGKAVDDLLDLGESKTSIASLVGVTASELREFQDARESAAESKKPEADDSTSNEDSGGSAETEHHHPH